MAARSDGRNRFDEDEAEADEDFENVLGLHFRSLFLHLDRRLIRKLLN
jgi:hypothetical protein